MPPHRATVNLPGLAFGQVADVTKKDAERWVDAGYLDPIAKSDAAEIQAEHDAGPSVVTPPAEAELASDERAKGKRGD